MRLGHAGCSHGSFCKSKICPDSQMTTSLLAFVIFTVCVASRDEAGPKITGAANDGWWPCFLVAGPAASWTCRLARLKSQRPLQKTPGNDVTTTKADPDRTSLNLEQVVADCTNPAPFSDSVPRLSLPTCRACWTHPIRLRTAEQKMHLLSAGCHTAADQQH
jgi:hypothetical protein